MGNEDVSVLAVHVFAAAIADQANLYIGIVVGLIAIAGGVASVFSARRRAVDRAAAEISKARQEGRESRDDEVALLRSQRDDARRDRDSAERERDEARRTEAEARRTLAMMQRPISDYNLPPHRPKPGES